ncbi:MAG: hypothetical protein LC689_17585 [Myxococcales bacterium]|nr:hypothetical protein [Myxococcales bacterium]
MPKNTKDVREMNRVSRLEFERSEAERLERERIDFEHRARMLRTNLYNTVPPRDPGRGWVDATRK